MRLFVGWLYEIVCLMECSVSIFFEWVDVEWNGEVEGNGNFDVKSRYLVELF